MKTILALQGDRDSGKTATITKLFELIKKNGYTVIQDKKRKNSHDFFVIVQKKGKKIGLCTCGDVKWVILSRIEIFIRVNCEVIVCACHRKGKTVEALQSVKGYSIEFFSKAVSANSNDHSKLNARDADILFRRVEDLVS